MMSKLSVMCFYNRLLLISRLVEFFTVCSNSLLSNIQLPHRPEVLPLRCKRSSLILSKLNKRTERDAEESFGNDSVEYLITKELNDDAQPAAVKIDVLVPTSKMQTTNTDLSKKSVKKNKSSLKKSDCLECQALEKKKRYLLPLYPCDEWNSKSRTCFLDRNIGGTVTFTIKHGKNVDELLNLVWKQEFHLLSGKKNKEFMINSENPPWNIVIGNKGYEFRLSPITEQDVDFNSFSVALPPIEKKLKAKFRKLSFKIRVIPINLGFVYLGETIVINIESFISLPVESMNYKWYQEKYGLHGTLPSNMKKSYSGRVLTISELRRDQEGIIACSVYSNLGVFLAKKRFFITEIRKNSLRIRQSEKESLLEEAMPLLRDQRQILSRKNRKLKIENDINEVLREMDNNYSGSNEYIEGYELPDSTSETIFTSSVENSLKGNEDLLKRLKSFRKVPELQRYNLNSYPLDSIQANNLDNIKHKPLNEETSMYPDIKQSNIKEVSDLINKPEVHSYRRNKGKEKNLKTANILKNSKTQQQPNINEIRTEDYISKLISKCRKKEQCSTHASCVRSNGSNHQQGFCRCRTGFYGNGIICWEDTSRKFSLYAR